MEAGILYEKQSLCRPQYLKKSIVHYYKVLCTVAYQHAIFSTHANLCFAITVDVCHATVGLSAIA